MNFEADVWVWGSKSGHWRLFWGWGWVSWFKNGEIEFEVQLSCLGGASLSSSFEFQRAKLHYWSWGSRFSGRKILTPEACLICPRTRSSDQEIKLKEIQHNIQCHVCPSLMMKLHATNQQCPMGSSLINLKRWFGRGRSYRVDHQLTRPLRQLKLLLSPYMID